MPDGEIEEYVAAGLTPFEALQTATVNTARLLNADADIGSPEPARGGRATRLYS